MPRPIHSYGKRGLKKPHINRKDHAIIYTDIHPGEQAGEGLNKRALQVIPDSPEIKLDPSSLINFGKIYTVEHNIKVKLLGRIAKESKHLLVSYYRGDGEPQSVRALANSWNVYPPTKQTSRQGGA